jgi:hypothetical protein
MQILVANFYKKVKNVCILQSKDSEKCILCTKICICQKKVVLLQREINHM